MFGVTYGYFVLQSKFRVLIVIGFVQREDPGYLVQLGYSPGALSSPEFDWARNLKRKLDAETVASLNYQAGSAFSLLWNMAKNQLPDEVIDDFTQFLNKNNFPQMAGTRENLMMQLQIRSLSFMMLSFLHLLVTFGRIIPSMVSIS